MGTNYYWHEPDDRCPTCGHQTAEPLHIGKSSFGWCFSLNTYPDRDITSLEDWQRVWVKGSIRDEYDRTISADEMLSFITERSNPRPLEWDRETYFANHAKPGPNNLARHRVDGRHCVANGKGTYDLMRGEFF